MVAEMGHDGGNGEDRLQTFGHHEYPMTAVEIPQYTD